MKIYNTLTGRKEGFLPQGDEVKIYVCGVTPYDDSHIGHAMSYIIFDVIRRYLKFRGYGVRYVQNITDIDDKIINRANKFGVTPGELAEQYAASFFADMAALNVMPADVNPRVTAEIPKIIEVIQGLVEKGFAYAAEGDVYFRVRSVADYGKLSRRNLESMMAGARIEAGEGKEYPMDFTLWKASKPGEPSWQSPWGEGRPGWHIECSAMALKYLGETIDIHGGGQDLVFPHHENEIVQSECFTGTKPFVKYWLHNGMLQFGDEKMSKSLGNLVTIKQALQQYSADAIRIFVLGSHYRSPLTYSEEALGAAEKGAERLRQAAHHENGEGAVGGSIDIPLYRQRFIDVMDDDFNTAQAIATLFDLAREINRADERGYDAAEARQMLKELSTVVGLMLEVPEERSPEERLYKSLSLEDNTTQNFKATKQKIEASLPQLVKNRDIFINSIEDLRNQFAHGKYPSLDEAELSTESYNEALNSLLSPWEQSDFKNVIKSLEKLSSSSVTNIGSLSDFREQLRKEKQWQYADKIRDSLLELNIALKDTPKGTVWKRRR